jgi:hypothetical protein
MPIHRSQYLKHTDLFLVRVWTEVEGGADANGNVAGKAEWHGRVQRVIDGEVHQFNSLQALTNLLSDMLSGPKESL